MKASKQHFQLVEGVIRTARTVVAITPDITHTELLDSLSTQFADAFEASNKSGFHRARFLQGCGYRGLTDAERARMHNEGNDE